MEASRDDPDDGDSDFLDATLEEAADALDGATATPRGARSASASASASARGWTRPRDDSYSRDDEDEDEDDSAFYGNERRPVRGDDARGFDPARGGVAASSSSDVSRGGDGAEASSSSSSGGYPFEQSPVLEREGDVYDKAEDAERMRSVSERVARHDKKMLARASEETDEGKDEAAERRPDSGEAGSIVLHTIPAEEALKYVSRVHHKEEVEAAEAAAALEAMEREQEMDRGSSLMDAADESYADLVGESDAMHEVASDIAEEEERSWSAVGERERPESRGTTRRRAGNDDEEEMEEDEDYDRPRRSSSHAEPRRSSGRSSRRSPRDEKDSEKVSSSAAADATPSSSRGPRLKRSPHATDVHAKHARDAARDRAARERERARREEREDRASSRGGGGGRGGSTASTSSSRGALGEGRGGAEATRDERRMPARAAAEEVRAGGAWRSARAEAQNQATYQEAKRAVFFEEK